MKILVPLRKDKNGKTSEKWPQESRWLIHIFSSLVSDGRNSLLIYLKNKFSQRALAIQAMCDQCMVESNRPEDYCSDRQCELYILSPFRNGTKGESKVKPSNAISSSCIEPSREKHPMLELATDKKDKIRPSFKGGYYEDVRLRNIFQLLRSNYSDTQEYGRNELLKFLKERLWSQESSIEKKCTSCRLKNYKSKYDCNNPKCKLYYLSPFRNRGN